MEQLKQQDTALSLEMQALALPDREMLAIAEGMESPARERDVQVEWLGTQSNALIAIERLKATIDEETSKLESRAVVDFDTFSQRKNRGLLELTRAIRLTSDIQGDPRVTPQLTQLRASRSAIRLRCKFISMRCERSLPSLPSQSRRLSPTAPIRSRYRATAHDEAFADR